MQRRTFLLFAAFLHGWPVMALAQRASKVYRIALFDAFEKSAYPDGWQAFRRRLTELGYVEGRNLVVDARWADSAAERMPAPAKELVVLRPDIIVANATPSARAAMQAAAGIPVEQANIQRLSINLRAAKAIGLAVPRSLLLRADEVIE